MNDLDLPLLPAELDELAARLAARSGSLGVDGAQGLITACLIGPEPPPLPQEWLMRVLGQSAEGESVAPPSADLVALVLRFQRQILRELDGYRYRPLLGLDDDARGGAAGGWCEGFVTGVDLRAGLWGMRLAIDTRLMELLHPIIALSLDEGLWDEFLEAGQPPLERSEIHRCMRALPSAVQDLRQYWRDHPPEDDSSLLRRLAGASVEASPPPRKRGGRRVH